MEVVRGVKRKALRPFLYEQEEDLMKKQGKRLISVLLSLALVVTMMPAFTLTANVTGAGETAIVYAAGYDAAGRMTFVRNRETQAGKTKYPFTIEAGTAEVKIYVLDKSTDAPLTEVITIR